MEKQTAQAKKVEGAFSKARRQRQRGRNQTKGFMTRTMAVNVRYKSLYMSLPPSAKQQREMTTRWVFWRTRMTPDKFSYIYLEVNAGVTWLA